VSAPWLLLAQKATLRRRRAVGRELPLVGAPQPDRSKFTTSDFSNAIGSCTCQRTAVERAPGPVPSNVVTPPNGPVPRWKPQLSPK
jgi:hypothetical protein